MTSFTWIVKDDKDKIWLFERKPKFDKENNCWWSDKGAELYDLDNHPIPLKTYMYISNQMRRVDVKNSLMKLDPKTWMIV